MRGAGSGDPRRLPGDAPPSPCRPEGSRRGRRARQPGVAVRVASPVGPRPPSRRATTPPPRVTVACRSCGRPVWWATTTHGKRMPVDAAPAPDGNLIIVDAHGQVVAPSAAFALLDRVPRVEVEV